MIRKLIRSDRDEIRDILEGTGHFNEEEIKVAMELIDIYLNDEKQTDYIIYVSEDENSSKPIGYICYGKRPLTDHTYDLYWIAVDFRIHGKGTGSKLVKHMEEDLTKSGGKIILIETSGKAEYENERKFYTKNGYDEQTIIKDFYRDGDDLCIYRKYLKEKAS
ncbi:MAG: GNAT family N-acetyltransferase [Ignavibacteria bacterium]|nr:GNAT family N-acetyltransferase [Ignavibacteria bacterium]